MSESASSSAASASASAASSAAAAAAEQASSNEPKKARTLAEMEADPRYQQGVALTKARKYDEALEFLGALVAVV